MEHLEFHDPGGGGGGRLRFCSSAACLVSSKVKKRHITVVEKTLDDSGQEVERTTHTEDGVKG